MRVISDYNIREGGEGRAHSQGIPVLAVNLLGLSSRARTLVRVEGSAVCWSSDRVRLLANVFPRNRSCFPRSQGFYPPCDLLLPGRFDVLVPGRVQAVDQGAG